MKRELVGGKKRPVTKWSAANSAMTKAVRANLRPGFKQQFVREDEVADKLSPDGYFDVTTGEDVDIEGWSVVKDKRRAEGTERYAAGTDTTVRQGNMVLMEIPESDFALLERKNEHLAAVRETSMMRGNYGNNEYAEGVNVTYGDPRDKRGARGFIPHQALETQPDATE